MVVMECGGGRARGSLNGVAHGGWMCANIGVCCCAGESRGLHSSMVQCSRLEYVASPTADTGVLAVSLVDRRALNSCAEPAPSVEYLFSNPNIAWIFPPARVTSPRRTRRL